MQQHLPAATDAQGVARKVVVGYTVGHPTCWCRSLSSTGAMASAMPARGPSKPSLNSMVLLVPSFWGCSWKVCCLLSMVSTACGNGNRSWDALGGRAGWQLPLVPPASLLQGP